MLYDRPLDDFQPLDLKGKHELFSKLSKEYNVFQGQNKNSTVFTEKISDKEIILRSERPGLIVSSTSWTEDEDFSILVNALDGNLLDRSSNHTRLEHISDVHIILNILTFFFFFI